MPSGGTIDGDYLSHRFKHHARRVELGRLRLHDLRHIAASRFLAAGASLPEVAAVLGHRTLVIARRYAHPQWDRLRALAQGAHDG